MLSHDEQANLARIARQLESDDPRLAAGLRSGRRSRPVVAAATFAIVAGTLCFILSLSLASTPLFVIGLIVLVAGWTGLILRCAR